MNLDRMHRKDRVLLGPLGSDAKEITISVKLGDQTVDGARKEMGLLAEESESLPGLMPRFTVPVPEA